jgi:ATP-binding cassette subfamily B multidrug efflux pump
LLKEFKTVLPLAKKHIWFYIFGLIFLFITNIGQLIIPQLLGGVINTFALGSIVMDGLLFQVVLILCAGAAVSLGRWGWRYFIIGASRKVEASLRQKLYDKWTVLGQKYFQSHKTGDLMALATNDLQAIRMATGFSMVGIVDGSFMAISILIIIFTSYPSIAIWTIIPLPVITVFILVLGGLVGKRFKEVQHQFSRLSGHVQEAFSGIKVIQSFVQEDNNTRQFEGLNDDYMAANMKLIRLWGLFFPLVALLSGATTVILLMLGGPQVIGGQLDPGGFSALLIYLGMLVWPMISVGFTFNMLQRGAASMARVNEVLKLDPEIPSPEKGETEVEDYGIEIKGLNFQYSQDLDPALTDINLEIKPGERLGILGPTGSGKSTLTEILCRFIDPPPGTVFLGGKDIREYQLPTLRRQYALVPQNPFLFSMSIKENIGFGSDDPQEEDLWRMAELSTITRDLETFPQGWETLVGEKGVTLSGGQKQRLTLARALVVNHPILILDDSLSAVDLETEEKILSHLEETRDGLTTILISHRTATLQKCDRIAVIEGGRITQSGTHQELAAQEGFYREIKHLQDLSEGEHHAQ